MNNKLLTYTKQELIDYILTLEKALKQKEDQLSINIKWAGNLGQWKWLYAENKVFLMHLKHVLLVMKQKRLVKSDLSFSPVNCTQMIMIV
ncbi:hypothetical protein [Acholeplasma laidlawii]|uniref:hypothetical protein n=1 Tax=Acholeplasma laidlawii TaxID=2148 RepID=UPI000B52247A|nr:hypothetical protein [Acholeplasma laidlawii]OWU87385.1 hypothetical protein A8G01_04775 [Acholeplasma laidlawii]